MGFQSRELFRERDIGYFDPDDKLPYLEILDKQQTHHNLGNFINAARVYQADVIPKTMVRRFQRCFLGPASTWYTDELDDAGRKKLKSGTMEECYAALQERFAVHVGDAVRAFQELAYILDDVYERKDPVDFSES